MRSRATLERTLAVVRDASLGSTCTERMSAVMSQIDALLPSAASWAITFDREGKLDSFAAGAREPSSRHPRVDHMAMRNYDARSMAEFAAHYVEFEPVGHRALANPDRVFASGWAWRPPVRTPLRDFLDPRGWRDGLTVFMALPQGLCTTIGLPRTKGASEVGTREVELLQRLVPDLKRAIVAVLVQQVLDERAGRPIAVRGASGALSLGCDGSLVAADATAIALIAEIAVSRGTAVDLLAAVARELGVRPSGREVVWPLRDGGWVRATFVSTQDGLVSGLLHPVAEGTSERTRLDALLAKLTPAERAAASGAVRGLGNREIGRELGVSAYTVKQQLAAAYRKLAVSGRTELASRVLRCGESPR